MNNVRGLYPPLYGAPANGGGGGGGSIQVDTLPEASLEYKDKIVQYTGATTETLTNGYFYKCVEHTETEGETITVTYSWDNVPVMEVDSGGGITLSETETEIGEYLGKVLYGRVIPNSQLVNAAISPDGIFNLLGQGITNIDTLVDSILWIKDTNNEQLTISSAVRYTPNNGGLYWCGYIRSSIAAAGIADKKLIIFYTKTN